MAANTVALPDGFVLDKPQNNTSTLPDGFVLDSGSSKIPFSYTPSNENRILNDLAQATAGVYQSTRFLPPVRFIGNKTGAEQALQNMPPHGMEQGIFRGVGNAIPTMIAANPLIKGATMLPGMAARPILSGALGFGGYGATTAALEGKPQEILPRALEYGTTAALFGGGSQASANLLKPIFSNPRIGSALGSAAAGYVSGLPQGKENAASNAVLGGAFGALYPSNPNNQKALDEAATIYKDLTKPSSTDIQKIEIGKGKDINDYYKIAALEKLPIQSNGKTIDTTEAINTLQPKIDNFEGQLNETLKLNDTLMGDKANRFDLNDIAAKAKENATERISNAKELADSHKQIDDYINAEILRYGTPVVNGETLNRIKQGMWSVGYKQMNPTAQSDARIIGNVIKGNIEESYKNADVKGLNQKIGDYVTLRNLLEKSHGKTIPKNIPNGVARIVGSIAGHTLGKIPVAGPLIGSAIGSHYADYVNSPERLSAQAINKVKLPGEPLDVKFGKAFGGFGKNLGNSGSVPIGGENDFSKYSKNLLEQAKGKTLEEFEKGLLTKISNNEIDTGPGQLQYLIDKHKKFADELGLEDVGQEYAYGSSGEGAGQIVEKQGIEKLQEALTPENKKKAGEYLTAIHAEANKAPQNYLVNYNLKPGQMVKTKRFNNSQEQIGSVVKAITSKDKGDFIIVNINGTNIPFRPEQIIKIK